MLQIVTSCCNREQLFTNVLWYVESNNNYAIYGGFLGQV
jgi:hypothetical protein